MRSLASLLLIVLSLAAPGISSGNAETKWVASEVVTSYVSGTSPTLILGLDNNLQICLALREAGTIPELRAEGIPATDSQRVLLQLWSLIERSDDGTMRCTIPIIEPPVTMQLDSLADRVAGELLGAVGPDIEAYIGTVQEAGWPGSRYALLGSFVLDGLAWKAFERLGAVETADASAMNTGSEHWSGVAWITLPPQPHRLGTNTYPTPDGVLCMSWTPSSLPRQQALSKAEVREPLTAMASDRLEHPSPDDSRMLEELGLIKVGKLNFPVVGSDSPLCARSGRLAMQVARALVASRPFHEMKRLTGAHNPDVAWIMAYHWVYPALMSRLEARGLARPPALDGDSGASLGPTVYVIANEADCVGGAE